CREWQARGRAIAYRAVRAGWPMRRRPLCLPYHLFICASGSTCQPLPRTRIERVAQGIAEEIEPHDRREDSDAGEQEEPPLIRVILRLADHGAPFGVGGRHAEADEG